MAKNVPASVKQQLLNLSRAQGWEFNWLLSRYANERLLYRISQSLYVERLILKGAFLFIYWGQSEQRPTRDIDFLGYGITGEKVVRRIFEDLCILRVMDDGVRYDPASIKIAPIQQGQEHHGYRVHLWAYLGKGRIRLQIDIGVGDVVTPGPKRIEFPTLLSDFPAPQLQAYPQEATIAEKTHAIIDKGIRNSRLKDFYDLWILSQHYSFSGTRLTSAIQSTFEQKKMITPKRILPLRNEFGENQDKQRQWKAFAQKSKLEVPEFLEIIGVLHDFLYLPLQSVREKTVFEMFWYPGGPWIGSSEK